MSLEEKMNQAKGVVKEGAGKLTSDKKLKLKVLLRKQLPVLKIAWRMSKVVLMVPLKISKTLLGNNYKRAGVSFNRIKLLLFYIYQKDSLE